MTDAVLRFLVELEGTGITRLKAGLAEVAKQSTLTATTTTAAGTSTTAAINRIVQAERSAAERSVQNAATRHAALRKQITDYREIASAAKVGSDEQIAANLLAEKAQQRLARETAVAAGEMRASYGAAGSGARTLERDVNRLGRGILSGSGLMRGMGRAAAFASTAFIGGAGLVYGLRSVYEETTKEELALKQLQTQLDSAGISWSKYGGGIEGVIKKDAFLAGADKKEVTNAFTDLVRTTGNLGAAEKLLGVTLDVSAGSHKSVATAATIVSRVFAGSLGILKRYGIVLNANVKTPLQALVALQDKFRGQAAVQGNSTAGVFARSRNSLHLFEAGLGEGALPVIRSELEKLTGALNDQQLQDGARNLGKTIATDVGGAIDTIVKDVHNNWPEIKRDFDDAKTILEGSATAVETIAGGLNTIAGIVPGKGSVLSILAELYIGKRLLLGKGGAAAAEKAAAGGATKSGGGILGIAEGIAGGLFGAKAAGKVAGLRTGLRSGAKSILTSPEAWAVTSVLASSGAGANVAPLPNSGRAADLVRLAESGQIPASVLRAAGDRAGLASGTAAGNAFQNKQVLAYLNAYAVKQGLLGAQVDALTGKYSRLGSTAAGTWNDVKNAIAAAGENVKAQTKALTDLEKSQQKAAAAAVQTLDSSFGLLTGDVGQAWDAKTSQMTDSISRGFDDATQKMLDRVRYRVDVVTKGIRESFTLTGDQKTPAERELAALDRISQKQNYQRNIFDAKTALTEARAIGDPTAIRDAQRALQDANTARKRYRLEPIATAERTAADAAKAAAQKQIQASQDAAKQSAINDVTARRNLEKRNLDATLAELLKEAEKGKIAGAKLAADVVEVLRKHGVDFKNAGDLLGKAFTTQLGQDLTGVKQTADEVHQKFDAIADTKERIKALAAEVAKLGAKLKDINEQQAASLKNLGAKSFTDFLVGTYTIDGSNPFKAKPVQKHAAGGWVTGPGGIDNVPAWLTAGELVLTAAQQRQLMGVLGVKTRKGILDRLRGVIATRTAAHPYGDTHPTNIESLVQHTVSRGQRHALGNNGLKGLEQSLAQLQAHPVLAGLVTPTPTGLRVGGTRRPFGSTITHAAFSGGIVININGAKDPVATARETRRELMKVLSRNSSLGFDD